MKKLQLEYNFLHILYWITNCAIFGYVAVFLQYKGLTNTEIGIVTGGGAVASIFMSPFISNLIFKISSLSIKKLMYGLYGLMFVAFGCLTLCSLPVYMMMALYICLIFLCISVVPLLSTLCMDYLKVGYEVNFGLSRGLGSVSYALSAVVIGPMIEMFDANVIAAVFVVSSLLMLVLLARMPEMQLEKKQAEKEIGAFLFIKKYRVFFFILLGFGCSYAAAVSLSTYLINIVHHLGGSTSLYGLVIFAMAASEMPIMAITNRLLKKYRSEILLLAAVLFYVLRNFTISLAPHLVILIIGMMFQGVSYGLFTAVITYYVNDHMVPKEQMMGQTMIGIMTTGVGSAVGNVLGGLLQDWFGLSSMLIFACAMSLLGAAIVFWAVRKDLS